MKIRQGFVSNSSSSSFMIGIGKIKDKESFMELIKDIKNDYRCDCRVFSTTAILEGGDWDMPHFRGSELYVTAHVNNEPEVSIRFNHGGDDEYFVVNVGNNEGDSAFWDGYELDYEKVDENWFVGDQGKLLQILKNKDLFHEVDYRIGAERDG